MDDIIKKINKCQKEEDDDEEIIKEEEIISEQACKIYAFSYQPLFENHQFD